MLSIKHQRFINFAADECLKSPVLMRHGCVAVMNGKVIGRGYNNYRNRTADGFVGENVCTCHSEMAALRQVHKNMRVGVGNTYGKWMDSIKVAGCSKVV
jgi:tRNA(Arg) A34 adenosine deaminase TadA